MQQLWMAIVPGPLLTRAVLMQASGESLLEVRLPHGPRHPQALERLCEALALWYGRPLHVVLAVDGADSFCATRRWLATFEHLTRRALYEIEFIEALPLAEAEEEPAWGYADIRRMLRGRMGR